MTRVLVTGANGFIGKNLCLALSRIPETEIIPYDIADTQESLINALKNANIIYHLAGVNRPLNEEEFRTGNVALTQTIIEYLETYKNNAPIIMTSSIQAELNNPYGISKKQAEEVLQNYHTRTNNKICIYRLPNVFGKWCKPNYNSVVATFCYNITHNIPLTISDPDKEITFIYIDDVVKELLKHIKHQFEYVKELIVPGPTYSITLGELAQKLQNMHIIKQGGVLPDLSNNMDKYLYTTLLSYYDMNAIAYDADKKVDQRGYLFELLKTKHSGQIFVSRTLPGITRGNHYHDTKIEKFCVLDGSALIKFRNMITNEYYEITVEGEQCKIIDIPPGWTHSITNVGTKDLLTLFWANEVFDQANPDTYYCEV